jgi:CelD/BcsL family acetyltransferase involved in cellulose biosynthesis
MHIDEIKTTDRLIRLREEWRGLWLRSRSATPFQHPDWLIPWWQTFGSGGLRVAAGWQGDRLVALAPLFENNDGVCTWIGAGITDYLDVIIDPLCDQDDTIQRHMSQLACDLDCIREGSSVLRLPGERARSHVAPVLTLPVSEEDLEPMLAAHFRKNLRRAMHGLESEGRVRIDVATEGNVAEMLSAFFELHGRRWSERGMAGVLSEWSVQQFHRRLAERLIRAGILHLYTMLLNDRPVASGYILDGRNESLLYLGGFDPAFSRYSPGSLLLKHAISAAIARGAREFHFLRGQEDYKYRWNAVDRPLWRLRTHGPETMYGEVEHVTAIGRPLDDRQRQ